METINNIAASAAKAVWGEGQPSTEEPVSGRTGDTSKGEPYDAGNMEPASANTVDVDNESANGLATNGVTTKSAEHTGTKSTELGQETGTRSSESKDTSDIDGAAEFAKGTGTAAESKNTPDNPSTELKAKSGPDDTSKGQGDTRSPEDPKTNPKSAPMDVDDSTNDEGVNETPQVDGPGPKPLADVAKEHGGDAGNNSTSSVDVTNKEEEEKKGEDDKHESKGTGEEYVRSSGVKADGGDFDATKPGAGREADRLLEQKGLHNPADPNSKADDSSSSPTTEKKSLGQKIKDKLHRH
ncbi:hypothetical protein HD806DRAFT_528402 [Xylariaceae sp. AK1471]|nr:hypothetical protein HD806DRAFT_528402 [Xylariaceae sp. AK1471]